MAAAYSSISNIENCKQGLKSLSIKPSAHFNKRGLIMHILKIGKVYAVKVMDKVFRHENRLTAMRMASAYAFGKRK